MMQLHAAAAAQHQQRHCSDAPNKTVARVADFDSNHFFFEIIVYYLQGKQIMFVTLTNY